MFLSAIVVKFGENSIPFTFLNPYSAAINSTLPLPHPISIKEYSLDEFNFREKSLRRLYNNNVNKPLLHRMQTTASNRVLNYKQ